jgi:hypothetical protein
MVRPNDHEHARAVRAARRVCECRQAARELRRFRLHASADRMERSAREYAGIVERYALQALQHG